jgi:hypothetical protein
MAMSATGQKRTKLLTEKQIRSRIGNTLEGSQKTSNLTFAVFAVSFAALTLVVSAPAEFRQTAVIWALAHWIVNLIWTTVAGLGWRTLPDEESEQLSKEERVRRLRLQTTWFRFWKGGYLLLVSVQMLLIGLGMLKHLQLAGWVDGLAVGTYCLAYLLSFWRRRHICHVRIVGYSPDTQWGRLMLRVGAIGPAVMASTCSAITIILARLQIVPKGVAAGFFGTLAVVLSAMIVPQVVYDFTAAWIHWQIYKTEANQAAQEW